MKLERSNVKRWECLFICLSTRVMHIEFVNTMSFDSFINALRRFIGRRGKPAKIFSDNCSNFIGAGKGLQETLAKFKNTAVARHLLQKNNKWHFNPLYSSNIEEVWERLIRSFWCILSYVLTQQTVSENAFLTLMIEVESILNSLPITTITMNHEVNVPLTPNHLFLLRELPNTSLELFSKDDSYISKRWRQVQ